MIAETGVTAARSAAVAGVGLLLAAALHRMLTTLGPPPRRVAWGALLVPFLTPPLLAGYGYANFSLTLVHHPLGNETLYGLLLLQRAVPLMVLVLHFSPPPPVSREALHCHRLAGRKSLRGRLQAASLWARGPGRALLAAVGAGFLLTFQDFQLASILDTGRSIDAWTVALFDAQAGGLPLPASLRRAAVPLAIEAATAVSLVILLMTSGRRPSPEPPRPSTVRPLVRWLLRLGGGLYLAATAGMGLLVPAALVLRQTLRGMGRLVTNPEFLDPVAASLFFAGVAAAVAWLAARVALGPAEKTRHRVGRITLVAAACLPGLLGTLLLGLTTQALFQRPPFVAAYDTAVPLLLALVVWLFPLAVLLHLVLRAVRPAEPLHLARLLSRAADPRRRWGVRLRWDLHGAGQFWAAFILFYWAYFEIAAMSLLHPVRPMPVSTPVSVRLYNLMHYGQSEVLSAMVVVATLVPVVLALVARPLVGVTLRWFAHV